MGPVVEIWVRPVFTFWTLTFAAGTTPPLASATTPPKLAVVYCAEAGRYGIRHVTRTIKLTAKLKRFMILLLLL